MFIAPDKKIRKYVAFSQEEHKWVHDPDMPKEYEEEFRKFVELAGESKGLVLPEEDVFE